MYLHKYSRTKISPRFMQITFSISLQILLNNVTNKLLCCCCGFFLFNLKLYSEGIIIQYVVYFENATVSIFSGISYKTFFFSFEIMFPL